MVLVFHCFTLGYHSSLLFLFSLFLFLGLSLYNIHAFHSRIVFVSSFHIKKTLKKKKEKGSKMCFALFFLDLNSRLANLFLHNMFMYLV